MEYFFLKNYINFIQAIYTNQIIIINLSSNSKYYVEVYVNDKLKLTGNGTLIEPGYHTIKLNKIIPLDTGNVFKQLNLNQIIKQIHF